MAFGGRYSWAFGYSAPVVKPGQSLVIKMIKGPRPDPMPEDEYDAHELLQFMGASRSGGATSDHRNCNPGPDGRMICR